MTRFLASRWTRAGLALVALGWGPLLLVGLLAELGLWSDPDPNPVGLGLLFYVTFWPAVACLGLGVLQALRRRS